MAKNKSAKIHEKLEVVQKGFANGVATNFPLNDKQKEKMIEKAAKAYDERIRETLDPNWVGIQNPNVREYLKNMPMTVRRELWQEMDKKKGFLGNRGINH